MSISLTKKFISLILVPPCFSFSKLPSAAMETSDSSSIEKSDTESDSGENLDKTVRLAADGRFVRLYDINIAKLPWVVSSHWVVEDSHDGKKHDYWCHFPVVSSPHWYPSLTYHGYLFLPYGVITDPAGNPVCYGKGDEYGGFPAYDPQNHAMGSEFTQNYIVWLKLSDLERKGKKPLEIVVRDESMAKEYWLQHGEPLGGEAEKILSYRLKIYKSPWLEWKKHPVLKDVVVGTGNYLKRRNAKWLYLTYLYDKNQFFYTTDKRCALKVKEKTIDLYGLTRENI